MARGMKHDDFEGADAEPLVVGEMGIRLERRDGEGEAEQAGLHVRVAGLGLVQGVEEDLGVGEALLDDGMIGEVVEMAVCEPKAGEAPAPFSGLVQERAGGVVGGVEEHGLFGGFIGDEEAIGHGDSAGLG